MDTLEKRFWAKVEKGDGCWIWRAFRMKNGYGTMGLGSRALGKEFAHRVSWVLHYGPIPAGTYVCHHCDNPGCVRPDHLFLGTPKDNMRDMIVKGRARSPGAPGFRNTKAKLTPDTIKRVFDLRAAGLLQREIGNAVGLTQGAVSALLRGQTWKHLDLPRQRCFTRRSAVLQ